MKYSGGQITKAGEALSNQAKLSEKDFGHAMDVMSYWRFCHEGPLNEAFESLRAVVLPIDRNAIFAKRLKRFVSIYKKLRRFEKMTLRNMQDIGGCRTIVSTEKKLWQCVRALKRRPEFKTEHGTLRAKDYITNPKEDGYRSYHLVGRFKDGEEAPRNIEIQIRTKTQHYWATALEIVDLFTNQALKSNRGNSKWRDFFREVGLQFSVMDSIHIFNSLQPSERVRRYQALLKRDERLRLSLKRIVGLTKDLKVVEVFEAYAGSIRVVNEHIDCEQQKGYVLLSINISDNTVRPTFYGESDINKARDSYIDAEKEAAKNANIVVALVSSDALGGIKQAYPNFFADSSEYVSRLSFLNSLA